MKRERDSKGRFLKGNTTGFAGNTTEQQREIAKQGGKVSAERQRERRTIAQVLRKVLDEPMSAGSELTRLDGIVASTMQDFYKKPSVKGLKIMAEILGELEENVNVNHNLVEKPVINIIPRKQQKGGE